uniref:Transcriptional regulator n=1 Tax=Heterorhabditis bacteriophora TaxID=37862 RepID=A0A1I7W7R1_HETBA
MNDVKQEPCCQESVAHVDCSCIIDLSTPATLERDFHAWLHEVSRRPIE